MEETCFILSPDVFGEKETLSCIDMACYAYITNKLCSGMCKKSKLRVQRELEEDFGFKKYLFGNLDL